jgi:NAD(P)-dependent dehydrogenase (short-subunit alcohol dehydrogenase family)/acyl carrier protein
LPAAARTAEAPAGQGVLEALRAIVSERTGYPQDMLDPDLDLEADLGIDSIKRIEILGELGERLNLGIDAADRRDQIMEELTVRKTLRAVVEWLEANRPDAAPRPAGSPSSSAALRQPEQAEVGRYVLSFASTSGATAGSTDVAGQSFVLANDGGGVATRVAERLQADGASATIVEACDLLANLSDGLDTVVYLTSLAAPQGVHPAKDLFELARHPAMERISRVVAATGMGGDFGRHRNGARPDNLGGVAGFLKSVAKERRGLSVRVIDLDLSESPDLLAAHIRAELSMDAGPVEVGYLRGSRVTSAVVAVPHVRSGSGPRICLDASSVILLIGGARGITARVAVALARRYRCRLELIGRSPEPDVSEFEVVGASRDPQALRQALIARAPNAAPAAIEAECARLRASEELRSTIAAIGETGGTARYTPVDVRDAAAFEAFLDGLYRRYDRLDTVIYGAGIVEDKLLRHKTRESFDRVFDTKVSGALTLARKLRKDVGAVVFFSSIAGAFGSRGQADYAAANDVLDKLAWALHERVDGRVVSINWGPWAESGMVSPELQREYGRRGIGLIAPDRGVEALIDELSYGVATDVQVILSNADPAIL